MARTDWSIDVAISSKQRRSHSSHRDQGQPQQLSSFTLHTDSVPNWSDVDNATSSKVQDSNTVTAQKKLDDGYKVCNYQSPQYRAAISVPWSDDARTTQAYVRTDYHTPHSKYISDHASLVNQSLDGTDSGPRHHTTNYNEINQTQNADSDLTHIKRMFEMRSAMSTQAPVAPAETVYATHQFRSTNYPTTANQGGYYTYPQDLVQPPPLDPPRPVTTGSNNAVQSTLLRRGQGPSYSWDQLPSTAPQHYAVQSYPGESIQLLWVEAHLLILQRSRRHPLHPFTVLLRLH